MILDDVIKSIDDNILENNISYVWNKVFPEEEIYSPIPDDIIEDLKEELIEFFEDIVNLDLTLEIYNSLLEEDLDEIELKHDIMFEFEE